MAVAFKTALGTGLATSSGTTIVITTTAAIAIGDLVVVRWASDNLNATTPTATCADGGNTYTVLRQAAVNATAAAGVAGGMLVSKATVARGSGSTITVTLSGSVAHKCAMAESFTGAESTTRVAAVGATGTATGASAGATAAGVLTGDLVLGHLANETRGTITGDTDTTNGAWSTQTTHRSATSGSDATCVSVAGQYKIPTAGGAQTYNVTAVAAEWVCQCAVLQATPDPAITQAAYQFFDDAGTEAGATALAAQNTAITGDLTNGDGFGALRIRLQLSAAAATPATDDWQLQWEKNTSGTWTNVATTGNTVLAYDNPNLTAAGPTTNRLTGGTGSFVAGEVTEDGVANDLGWSASNFTEILYSLKLLAANFVAGDTLRFRVLRNGATTTMTYSVTPTINIIRTDPAVTQAAYRFYADGTESGSTALASQDTGITSDVSGGDVNVQLRMRLQSTNIANIPAGDWQLQYEKNDSGTWVDAGPGAESLADSYQTGSDLISVLGTDSVGQSFLGNGQILSKVSTQMKRNGTTAGLVTYYIYAHSGTFGVDGVPTGAPLATSIDTYDANMGTILFPRMLFFDETLTLQNGVPYFLVAEAVLSDGQLDIGSNSVSPSHAGNAASFSAGWSADPGTDLRFEVYTKSPSLNVGSYDSPNLTDSAATTNRLTGGSGSFVAGEVSEDGKVDVFGWTANNFTEVLFSITLKQADLAEGDTLDFRVLKDGVTTGMTYTVTPRVTIPAGIPPQTWTGSVATIGVAADSGTLVGGDTTWTGGSTALVGVAGISGEFYVPPPQTWTGGSTAVVGVSGVSGDFVGGAATWTGGSTALIGAAGQSGVFVGGAVTWVGSTAAIGAAGQSDVFTPGGVTWVGSTAAVGTAGISGSFVAGDVTWVGSTAAVGVAGQTGVFLVTTPWTGGSIAAVGVAGQSGAFVPGGVTWVGSAADVGVAGITGTLVGGPTIWVGSTAAIGAAGQSGAFTSEVTWFGGAIATIGAAGQTGVFAPGTAVWGGSVATVGAAGQSGAFVNVVVWVGSIAAVGAAGQSGSFLGGATVWTGGSLATVGVTGSSGLFTAGGAWPGSIATIGVAGISGSFVAAPITWTGGSIGQVGLAGQSGSFVPGAIVWVGSPAKVGVEGITGLFIPGALAWVGSTAAVGLAGISDLFIPGERIWEGSEADIGLAGISGVFIPGDILWIGSDATVGVTGMTGIWVGAVAIGHWNGQDFMEMQYETDEVVDWTLT